MTNSIDDRLEDVEGTYFDILSRVNAETIQHSDQLVAAFANRPLKPKQLYWPADFAFLILEGHDVILYLARLEANPWVSNPSKAHTQLMSGAYFVTGDEIEIIRRAHRTVRVNTIDFFRGLDEAVDIKYYRYYILNPVVPHFENEDEQTVFERFCGKKNNFRYLDEKGGIYHVIFNLISRKNLRRLITEEKGVGFVPALKSEPPFLRIYIDPLEAGPYYGGYMRAVPINTS